MRETPAAEKMTSIASDITYLDSDSDSEDLVVTKGRRLEDVEQVVNSRQALKLGRALNVAIIGPPGVGKSSFVNSIGAAFSKENRWREYASYGHHGGEADPITTFTTKFNKCCNEDDYPDVSLPTLIDIAGFPDENTDKWLELLRIVFYGRLPEGESLGKAQEICEHQGINGLREHFVKEEEKLKVDRIIFVASATQPVPVNLIKCVLKAARPPGTENNPAKRTIPIFGVMTKKDKVTLEKDIQAKEKAFVEALGLGGAGHRYLLCSNYCDDVDHGSRTERTMPEIDVPVLKFLRQVFDPVIRVQNDQETLVDVIGPIVNTPRAAAAAESATPETILPRSRFAAQMQGGGIINALLGQYGITKSKAAIYVLVLETILVAVIFQFIFNPAVDVVKMRSACSSLHDERLNQQSIWDTNPVLADICVGLDSREFFRKFVQFLGFIIFVILRLGVTLALTRFYGNE